MCNVRSLLFITTALLCSQTYLLQSSDNTTDQNFAQDIKTFRENFRNAQNLLEATVAERAKQAQALKDTEQKLIELLNKSNVDEFTIERQEQTIETKDKKINERDTQIKAKDNEIRRKDAQLNRPFNRFGNSLQDFYERAALFAHTNRNQLVVGGAVGAGVLTYAALWHYNRAPLQKVITSAVAKQISPFTLPYTKPVADFCAQNISTPLTQGFGNVSTFIGSLNASVKNNSYTLFNTVFPFQTR